MTFDPYITAAAPMRSTPSSSTSTRCCGRPISSRLHVPLTNQTLGHDRRDQTGLACAARDDRKLRARRGHCRAGSAGPRSTQTRSPAPRSTSSRKNRRPGAGARAITRHPKVFATPHLGGSDAHEALDASRPNSPTTLRVSCWAARRTPRRERAAFRTARSRGVLPFLDVAYRMGSFLSHQETPVCRRSQ